LPNQPEKDVLQNALGDLRPGACRAVLLVEPNPDHQSRLARMVTRRGHRAIGASTLDGGLALLQAFPVDLVMVAEEACFGDPTAMVAELVSIRPHARVVIMIGPESTESGVRPARFEALEYAPRPSDAEGLRQLLAS